MSRNVLESLGAGFSPPLVVIFLLGGLAFGIATYRPPAGAAQPADSPASTPSSTPVATPASPRPAAGSAPADAGVPPAPRGGASPAQVQAQLKAGELEVALEWADAAGLEDLREQANLLLTLSRSFQPGPFASAKRFLLVDGKTLGAIREETDDGYWIEPIEGGEQAVQRGRAQVQVLERQQALTRLATRLRAARDAAAADGGNGLAMHRQAFLAFRAGLRALGVELLSEALRTKEGTILVDMFGSGDLERLQRARSLLAGEQVGPLAQVEPAPAPSPSPVLDTPVSEPAPAPSPSPRPATPSRNPLEQEPAWVEAERAYRAGLERYRGAFSLSVQEGAPAVRAAMAQFRRAQDLLDPLLDKGFDPAAQQELERRLMELNSLVLDCTKHLGTGG